MNGIRAPKVKSNKAQAPSSRSTSTHPVYRGMRTWARAHPQNQPLGAIRALRRRRRPDAGANGRIDPAFAFLRIPRASFASLRGRGAGERARRKRRLRRRKCGGDATTTNGYVAAPSRVLPRRLSVRRPYDVTDHEEVAAWRSPSRREHAPRRRVRTSRAVPWEIPYLRDMTT